MQRLVFNNYILKSIVYKTENVIIKKIHQGKKDGKCYIIGPGTSLSVGTNNRIVHHDPGMREFVPKLSEDYTIYVFYFTFEATGLREASKDISTFVDNLHFDRDYTDLILVGHSKAGVCLSMACETCTNSVTLVTISAPFYGTMLADKEKAESVLKFRPFIFIYRMIFSDHNVDKDITPKARYKEKMPVINCKKHINITSELSNIDDCQSMLDILLLFMDKYMHLHGDGVVPKSSQSVLKSNSLKTINISSSHARSLKDGLQLIENLNLV